MKAQAPREERITRGASDPNLLARRRRASQQRLLLQLEVVELLLPIHLDDERHHEHQEGGARDPRRLARAPEQLLGHGGSLATVRRHLRPGEGGQEAVPAVALAEGRRRRHGDLGFRLLLF
jgi:hypothetical protein